MRKPFSKKEDAERWAVLGLDAPTERYDIVRLELSPLQLQAAVDNGYADPEDAQNDSPTIGEFLEFGQQHRSAILFEAYIVSPTRSDCRISVEGILLNDADGDMAATFKKWAKARHPDEFDNNRAWWD